LTTGFWRNNPIFTTLELNCGEGHEDHLSGATKTYLQHDEDTRSFITECNYDYEIIVLTHATKQPYFGSDTIMIMIIPSCCLVGHCIYGGRDPVLTL
jgi:hypothetical protein